MKGKKAPSLNKVKKNLHWAEQLAGIATEEEVQSIARNMSALRGTPVDIGAPPKVVYRGTLAQKRFKI